MAVARWISETVHVTQLEVKQGRWVIGNIGFTRHGQEHLTKLARDILADDERSYTLQQSDPDPLADPGTIEDVLAVENDVVPFDRAHVLGAGLRQGLPW